MKPRTIKIQPRINQRKWDYTTIPELILKGNWLQEAGFAYGMTVRITKENNRLIIEPANA